MANIVEILIKANAGQAKTELRDFERRLNTIGNTAGHIGNRLALLGGAGAAGMALLGRSMAKTTMDMEQTRVAFRTLMGSSEAAQKALANLSKFARETPFEFGQVTSAAKQLLALGFSAEQVIPMLRTLGDATSALGTGSEGLGRIILQLGQMKAAGRATMEDLRPLMEAGVPVFAILQEKLKLTGQQIQNIGKQSIDANTVIQALLSGMNERFGGGMEQQAKTMAGIISNMSDLWSQFISNAEGTGLGDVIAQDAKPALEELLDTVTKLKNDGTLDAWARDVGSSIGALTKRIGELVEFFAKHPQITLFAAKLSAAAVAAALVGGVVGKLVQGIASLVNFLVKAIPVMVGLAGATSAFVGLLPEIASLADVGALIVAALGPVGAAIAAVVAAVAGLALAWKTNFLGIQDKTKAFFDWFAQNAPGMARVWDHTVGAIVERWKQGIVGMRTAWQEFCDWIPNPIKTAFTAVAGAIGRVFHDLWDLSNIGMMVRYIEKLKGWIEGQTKQAKSDKVSSYIGSHPYAGPTTGLPPGVGSPLRLDRNQGLVYYGGRFIPRAEAERLLQREQEGRAASGKPSVLFSTTNGASPGAAKAKTSSEMEKWITEESKDREKAIRDYIRTKWGEAAAAAFRVTNRRHNGYKAMDIVSTNQRSLTWNQLAEASREAGGLRNSSEIGYANMSPRARRLYGKSGRGSHIHAFLPTEGQQAAYQNIDEARKDAESKRKEQAQDAARAGAEAGKAYAAAMDRIMGALPDSARNALQKAKRDNEQWRKEQIAGAHGNKKAIAGIEEAYAAQNSAIYRAYYTRLDDARKQDLEKDKKAAQERLDTVRQEVDSRLALQRAVLDARLSDPNAQLGPSDVDAMKQAHLDALTAAAAAGTAWTDLLRMMVEFGREERDLGRDIEEQQKRQRIATLQQHIAELQYHIDWMKAGKEKQEAMKELIDLQRELMKLQGDYVPEGYTKDQQDQIDRAGQVAKKHSEQLEEVVRSFSDRLASVLGGEKAKNAWAAFLEDMKRMFLRWLADMLAKWILHELEKTIVTRGAARDRQDAESGEAGGKGTGGILGGLFGKGKGSVSAGGDGTIGGDATVGELGAAAGGYFVGQKLMGKKTGIFAGIGGAAGGAVGYAYGGPIGAAIGSMIGAYLSVITQQVWKLLGGMLKGIGKGISGLFGGLFKGLFGGGGGEKHSAAELPELMARLNMPGGYSPNHALAGAVAGGGTVPVASGPGPQRSPGGGAGPGRPVNVTQNNYIYQSRSLEATDQDLANRVARAIRTKK